VAGRLRAHHPEDAAHPRGAAPLGALLSLPPGSVQRAGHAHRLPGHRLRCPRQRREPAARRARGADASGIERSQGHRASCRSAFRAGADLRASSRTRGPRRERAGTCAPVSGPQALAAASRDVARALAEVVVASDRSDPLSVHRRLSTTSVLCWMARRGDVARGGDRRQRARSASCLRAPYQDQGGTRVRAVAARSPGLHGRLLLFVPVHVSLRPGGAQRSRHGRLPRAGRADRRRRGPRARLRA
jgi:hypothetical protein